MMLHAEAKRCFCGSAAWTLLAVNISKLQATTYPVLAAVGLVVGMLHGATTA